ncbi:hypothetical protein FB565_004254 [Actinoplanes lutulentus]|uniref:amidase domain-containing protein n=1 Tax=Actinoplanes lutulentus TaxID=1287878 RepID=UPI0011B94727|nr:amidase domain-containing protein [Actinoplanes lutulentus]MBB2944525.1 hypothetical protein [Actinoplanes lutulentus]
MPSAAQAPAMVPPIIFRAGNEDLASALASAKQTGERVRLDDATTETSEYFATPGGDVVGVISSGMVRFQRNGTWVPIDLTLRRHADGSVAPAEHPDSLRLSGARTTGSTDLASLGGGVDKVTMGWQGKLPEPRLEGSKATYPEVRPGVDLVVQATPTGFEQFTVLKSAAAAKRITEIALPLTGRGVDSASEDKHGRVRVRGADGDRSAFMPTPLMWDSAKNRPPTRQVAVDVANASASASSAEPAVTLRLKPDRKWLNDPKTVYPVVIDPQITRLTTTGTVTVMKGYPTAWVDADSIFVGAWDSSLIARSFVTWDATALRGQKIKSAKVNFASPFASSCEPRPWEIWTTDAPSSASSWDSQPAWRYKESTSTSTTCADSWVSGDATNFFQRAATGNVSTPTMGLRASSETDYTQYKQFWSRNSGELAKVPYVEVTYANPTTGPGVSSTAYREEYWAGNAGVAGSFTFTQPTGLKAAAFLYGLNVNPPTTVVTATTSGTATVNVTPATTGVQTLYVRSRDSAGVLSAVTAYQFGVGDGVNAIGYRPERTMTAAEITAQAQLVPLAKQFLQNRANEITGHYDNTAGIPMWNSEASLAVVSAAELQYEGDTLLMDNLDYEVSTVSSDTGMVQISGNQANLWLREETSLAMPSDDAETAYGHSADRAFVFVRSGTTWALADQRLVALGAVAPLTEPMGEFEPVLDGLMPEGEPAPEPGGEIDYNFGTTEPTTDEPATEEPAESSSDGSDPIWDGEKVDGEFSESSGFTTAGYSTAAAKSSGMVLAGTIPKGLCYSCMVTYARKWAMGFNPGYRITKVKDKNGKKVEADCTNFVSQVMQAGKWKEDSGWYQSNGNWWYTKANQTWTWGGANNFSKFVPKRTQNISSIWKAGPGDIIQADWTGDGTIDHTMVVTKTDQYDVYVTGHTNAIKDKPMSKITRDARARNSRVKFYAYRT